MLLTNEPYAPGRRPAPRIYIGRTIDTRLVRVAASLSDHDAALLPRLADDAITTQLAPTERTSGPCYAFPATLTTSPHVVAITLDSWHVARDTYPWLADEVTHCQPCFAIVVDGAAVSLAFTARSTPQAAEVGVDTLAPHRGRGYAAAVTLAWAAAVRASGRVPLYSTSDGNLSSQSVARRCGLVEYARETTWT
jgi:hypothetical protein